MPIFGGRKTREDVPVAPQPAGFGHRTPEQIEEALGRAHQVRRERKELLDRVKGKEVTLQDILEGPYRDDPLARGTRVRTLLRALPGVTPTQADRLIAKVGIHEGRKVSGLGVNQKTALLEWRSHNMPMEGEE